MTSVTLVKGLPQNDELEHSQRLSRQAQNKRQHLFAQRRICLWNSLPQGFTREGGFKGGLDTFTEESSPVLNATENLCTRRLLNAGSDHGSVAKQLLHVGTKRGSF